MSKTKEQAIELGEQQIAQEENGLSLELSGFIKLTKGDISDKVRDNVTLVTDGYVDALDALILAKKITEYGKQLESKVRPIAEEKTYGKEYRKHNVDVVERMSGVSYDYADCGYQEYDDILLVLEPLLKRKKEIEEELQKMVKSREEVNVETGETYKVSPPIKKGKLGLILTIK